MLFKVIKLLVVLFSFIAISTYGSEYEKVGVNVRAENISGSSYYVPGNSGSATEFEGFISNSGFVITKDGVVVIDTLGSPSLGSALLEEIRKLTDNQSN